MSNQEDRKSNEQNAYVRSVVDKAYEFGFTTDVETEVIDRGLTEDTVRLISAKKGEPEWLLEFRLKAFHHWLTLKQPTWGHLKMPDIDYQDISYFADPTAAKKKEGPKSLDEIDPTVPL